MHYEETILYCFAVAQQPLARELYYQIQANEISFYQAAHLHDLNLERRLRCGFDGRVTRDDFGAEFSEIIFGAEVQSVIPPVKTKQGYELLWVEARSIPQLTPELRQKIVDSLFESWLEKELRLRREAIIPLPVFA